MNNKIKISLALLATVPFFSSCLQEFLPTDTVTQEQVNKADKTALTSAIPAYLNKYNTDDYAYDIGFGGFNIFRDSSTADMTIFSPSYDYYWYVGDCTYLDADYSFSFTIFRRYYALVQKTNLVFEAVNPEVNSEDEVAAVQACSYRALAYLEMGQWFEYKHTGIAALDGKAESDGIYGLTVPIVTEKTTELESRNNPRAPFYKLYRFILTDLNNGEKYAAGKTEPSLKTEAGQGVIYGLKARLWLLLGSRFDKYPADLETALSHENDADIPYDKLGISSAQDCFRLAAEYARKAINRGYTPLTETQWFDPKTGFNTVNNSWMLANVINSDNGLAKSQTWGCWPSYMSAEPTYGIGTPEYKGYRCIDSRLFAQIPSSDWRKTTWIDPNDVGSESAYNTKYARGTNLNYDTWKDYGAYCNFKFHPGSGDINTSTVGNAVSIPMMRVEEMYLIEAEAAGRSSGEGTGRALLEQFVNTYRYKDGSYKSKGAGLEGFIDDVFLQKRIELWGEGQIMWDYRRLEKAVVRGYPGTNWPESYRFNSNVNAVAPWSTLVIPQRECTYNTGIINNPNPSSTGVYDVWEE